MQLMRTKRGYWRHWTALACAIGVYTTGVAALYAASLFNLATLNFGYHNAHHLRPTASWYELPALHRALCTDARVRVLPVGRLLRAYHRCRVARVMHGDPPDHPVTDAGGSVGVVGVSFVTAH